MYGKKLHAAEVAGATSVLLEKCSNIMRAGAVMHFLYGCTNSDLMGRMDKVTGVPIDLYKIIIKQLTQKIYLNNYELDHN